ncbi:MAG: hypothetical protein WA971_13385, partial [Microbacterium sp.]
SDVHERLRRSAEAALAGLGIPDAAGRSAELFALADALVLQRIAHGAAVPAERIVRGYLRGAIAEA